MSRVARGTVVTTAADLLAEIRRRDDAPTRPKPVLFEPFPLGTLPEKARRYVREAAGAIGCDPVFIVQPLLAVLAASIGNSRTVMIKPSWREPSILWTATVARSGTCKSPAFRAAVEFVERIEDRLRAVWAEEVARAAKDDDAAAPPEPHLCLADATVESVCAALEGNRRGLLVARDELSSWIASLCEYKGARASGDEGRWLQLFDAGTLKVTRKAQPTIRIRRASVSLTGTIQPAVLRDRLTRDHVESGLAARFLFATPPERPLVWSDRTIAPAVEADMLDVVEGLYSLAMATDDHGSPVPLSIDLADEAREAFIEFFNASAKEQSDLSDDEGRAAWSKLRAVAARLALIHHLVTWSERRSSIDPGGGDRQPSPISLASMEAGIVLARWYAVEQRRLYAGLAGDTFGETLAGAIAWIEAHGGTTSVREMQRNGRTAWREPGVAQDLLDALEDAEVGRFEDVPTTARGGRPTQVFHLLYNP